MSRSRFGGLMLVVLTVGACTPDGITGASTPIEGPSLNVADGSIKKSFDLATGSVEADAFSLNHKYAFLAYGQPGSTAQGTWEWTGQHPDATWHASGVVICLRVVDNVAQVSGVITQTDAYWAQPPFNYAVWTVVDMGNKKKSPPDHASLMSVAVTAAQAAAHCETNTFQYTPPVTSGEVIVRPARLKPESENAHDSDESGVTP
jgi:hypothetical protein